MRVTMVKKLLADGTPCRKCAQAEDLLRRRGVWERLDEVVIAQEGDPDSPGMKLAQQHQVDLAPFWIVEDGGGPARIYTSAISVFRDVLAIPPGAPPGPDSDDLDFDAAARELSEMSPPEIVQWTLERFGSDCTIAFSGAEDVVLIDMAIETGLPFSTFVLDTGRLHAETYEFIDQVRRHYGITVDVLSPNAGALEAFVREKGLFSFYEDGHQECCGIRKVEPLTRALRHRPAWMTGQRRDQSPTRAHVPILQPDPRFSGPDRTLVKVNPLAEMSEDEVWAWIRERHVPFNPLHDRGFASIGCAPCTRATHRGQHPREGRWWWEESTKRECGLHLAPTPGGRRRG